MHSSSTILLSTSSQSPHHPPLHHTPGHSHAAFWPPKTLGKGWTALLTCASSVALGKGVNAHACTPHITHRFHLPTSAAHPPHTPTPTHTPTNRFRNQIWPAGLASTIALASLGSTCAPSHPPVCVGNQSWVNLASRRIVTSAFPLQSPPHTHGDKLPSSVCLEWAMCQV